MERLRPEKLETFALEAAPRVFEWFRWSLSLAVVGYAADIAKSLLLDAIFQISLCLLGLYYFVYFRKLMYGRGGILRKHPAVNASLSILVAAVLGFITYVIVLKLISAANMFRQ